MESNTQSDVAAIIESVITSRRSVRQFLPNEICRETITELLDIAAYAPSGHNTQAWNVYVVTGSTLDALSKEILSTFEDPEVHASHIPEFDAYPTEWVTPFIDRRRALGREMYGVLGIPRGESERMLDQAKKNYAFFDAPVGLMFTVERIMLPGSALDLGMFMQTLMIAAKAIGLDTCPQQAFSPFHRIIRKTLSVPESQVIMCGMSLGYANPLLPINDLKVERVPASSFTKFYS